MAKIFALLYWLTGIVHLAIIIIEPDSILRFITKPMLMPLLIAWYFIETNRHRTIVHWIMIVGFVFSCAGDVFLMYKEPETFFLFGLGAFLITHVLYIIAFRKEISAGTGVSLLRKKPYLALPVVALAAGLVALVFNKIEPEMKIPVNVYAAVITVMVVTAIARHGLVSQQSFVFTLAGALLFMFSDSLIALDKFYFSGTLPHASLFIMLLYIAGQFLIAKGTVRLT